MSASYECYIVLFQLVGFAKHEIFAREKSIICVSLYFKNFLSQISISVSIVLTNLRVKKGKMSFYIGYVHYCYLFSVTKDLMPSLLLKRFSAFCILCQWFPKSGPLVVRRISSSGPPISIQISILCFAEHWNILSGPRTRNVWEPLCYAVKEIFGFFILSFNLVIPNHVASKYWNDYLFFSYFISKVSFLGDPYQNFLGVRINNN